jgi:hypothetical protein
MFGHNSSAVKTTAVGILAFVVHCGAAAAQGAVPAPAVTVSPGCPFISNCRTGPFMVTPASPTFSTSRSRPTPTP